ncbi:MAG TPA: glycosyltransferase family 87 protein [Candidatus Limnocylindrales bacterium]
MEDRRAAAAPHTGRPRRAGARAGVPLRVVRGPTIVGPRTALVASARWVAAVLRSRPALVAGLAALVGIWLTAVLLGGSWGSRPFVPDQDARAYWLASAGDPYRLATVGMPGAYLYSPAFLQVLAPLRALSWTGFVAAWTLVLLVAAAWLSGPWLLGPALALVLIEVWGGNITLLLALAIVLGFRWPASWAFVLLTKVTPGVGLLWFAVRREWANLAATAGATLGIVAVSAVLAPGEWRAWLHVLAGNAGTAGTWAAIPVPLLPRLPLAALVVAWAARTDRRWALPVGCLLAMPVIWYGSLTLLLAVPALRRSGTAGWAPLLARLGAVAGTDGLLQLARGAVAGRSLPRLGRRAEVGAEAEDRPDAAGAAAD